MLRRDEIAINSGYPGPGRECGLRKHEKAGKSKWLSLGQGRERLPGADKGGGTATGRFSGPGGRQGIWAGMGAAPPAWTDALNTDSSSPPMVAQTRQDLELRKMGFVAI